MSIIRITMELNIDPQGYDYIVEETMGGFLALTHWTGTSTFTIVVSDWSSEEGTFHIPPQVALCHLGLLVGPGVDDRPDWLQPDPVDDSYVEMTPVD